MTPKELEQRIAKALTEPFSKESSWAELYEPAMYIEDEHVAKIYLGRLVEYGLACGFQHAEALEIQKENLGYYAGYYDASVRERVERLFGTEHPIFGSIVVQGEPTPDEALEAGKLFAQYMAVKDPETLAKALSNNADPLGIGPRLAKSTGIGKHKEALKKSGAIG